MTGRTIIADVGGTNTRLAMVADGGKPTNVRSYKTSAFARFSDTLEAYGKEFAAARFPSGAIIAAAGPVAGDQVRLTNGTWTLKATEIARQLGDCPVTLMNDLQASALSIPTLSETDVTAVADPAADRNPDATRLAVNVGTGFGSASLIRCAGGWMSAASESGHMTLAATRGKQWQIVQDAEAGFASVEDILSGPGLQRLHTWLAGAILPHTPKTPREILEQSEDDRAAREAVRTFARLLGRVCGDLVLASGAWGGVYFFGSVMRGWLETGTDDIFLEDFTKKGKMTVAMTSVPVFLVEPDDASLRGLAASAPHISQKT